ncbi:hypothetical protein MYU51_021179 [Penicillium brevicompactum]|uniref:uncharacterized protein n=1 Tax=Penicillium brevicompactum TaxID=5074 RepID=UPI002540A1DC|nr:uncharacterized protein N7506_005505 [Penicillium brevicompactum]KAJ5337483.1 hypothetical protein N7506_005505 [Penicillium brevicompactum]
MHSILAISLVLSLALFSTAALNPCSFATNDMSLTEAQLIQIAPQSKSCDDAPAKGECATAKTAADSISQSFNTYNVTNKAEQVAILSLMAFESNDFKYNKNHFPGILGQGTRNMQSPAFNKKYAKSIPELKSRFYFVENIPADLLDLLRENKTYDFGSGAWFLTTYCSKEVRSALQDGSEKGWKNYITIRGVSGVICCIWLLVESVIWVSI